MSDLKITPLGTISPYCKGNKNCAAFLFEYDSKKYLFDCGNGITRYMNMNEDLKKLKVFISHLHVDHYGDVLCLAQAALVYKRLKTISENIDIYIPGDDFVAGTNKHIEDYHFLHSLSNEYPVNVIDYENICLEDGDVKISSIYVPHQVKAHAFKFETPSGIVVYSGDTGTHNELREFAKNADLFICESTFLNKQIRTVDSHLYTHDAARIAKDANVKHLLLTHFWPETGKDLYVNEAKEIFEATTYAEENKPIILKR